jgi:hypothetical protein
MHTGSNPNNIVRLSNTGSNAEIVQSVIGNVHEPKILSRRP